MIYWLTGQPGAGKTTLAKALKKEFELRGCPTVHIDGDDLRKLQANADYSSAGRVKNIRAAQEHALASHTGGSTVVVSLVSPFRSLREEFKAAQDVLEVYVHTTEQRGREAHFVRDYEPPLENFVDVDTTHASVEDCLQKIIAAKIPREHLPCK